MTERDRFELDLAEALRAYAEEAPTRVHPTELARRYATAYPRVRTRFVPRHWEATRRLAWTLLVLVGLVIAMVGGMLIVGSRPAPAFGCPAGTNPDQRGPVDQARPGDPMAMAFDRRAGRIISVTEGAASALDDPETWTFDICTNTWAQVHATPPRFASGLVYDVDSDVAIAPSSSGVWVYDLTTDTWTEKDAPPIDVTSLTYDPAAGLVVAGSYGEPWNYDVETDEWTPIVQTNEPGGERGYVQFAYDTSVDRIVAYDNGNATSLLDIRTGTWSRSDTETPRVQAFYGMTTPAIAYDEAAERTVVKGWDLAVYDAVAHRWDVTPTDVEGHTMAYDPVNERLVVQGSSGQMTAIDTRTGKSTVLLEPRPAVVISGMPYESANQLLTPGVLDVYAPARDGGWPVVVMFHGGPPLTKADLRQKAERVADLGFVVFAATWGAGGDFPPTYEQLLANQSQAACAVAFARTHAAEYGGDPDTMIVFGHSAGANMAALTAFAQPEPTAGCLGGTELGAIDALVTYEGDWVAMGPDVPWDSQITADPRIMDGYTPWTTLPERPDLRVAMLVSEQPGVEHRLSDAAAVESFIAVRDPSGDLRAYLEANDAFADGAFDLAETQQVLFSALQAQGNPVSLDVLPGSTHLSLSDAGWEVFLEAFGKVLDRVS